MSKDEFRKSLELKTRHSGRDFWHWKDKLEMEWGVASEIVTAAGLKVEKLTSRMDDPPDCEALVNGEWCGIEVTELVHEAALKLSIRGGEQHFVWEKHDLCERLQTLISRKDCPEKVKGGPYQKYILVICTDELFLDRSKVEQFIANVSFRAGYITDVFLGLSYDPKTGSCPVFKLPIVRGR